MRTSVKLTKRVVEAWKPADKEQFVWDAELKGFGLRVAPVTGGKSFVLQYRVGARQRRQKLGRFPALSVEAARKAAIRDLAMVAAGRDPALERVEKKTAQTVAEVCDQYMAAARADLVLGRGGAPKKASTVADDAGRIERHIKPLIGSIPIREVTAADVERFKLAVAQGKTAAIVKTKPRGVANVRGGKGAATRALGLLGAIFVWARSQGMVTYNPVPEVRRFADRRRDILYSDDQLALLGAALRQLEGGEQRGRLNLIGAKIIRLIVLTGLRRNEARRLRWDEVDLEGSCLRLKASKSVKVRPLGRAARELLKSLDQVGEYVFPAVPGGLPYDGLPRWWARLKAVAAALRPDSPSDLATVINHGFRHTLAGTAARMGLAEATAGAVIGHKSGGVTAGYIYTPVDEALLAATDRVTDRIAAAMELPLGPG